MGRLLSYICVLGTIPWSVIAGYGVGWAQCPSSNLFRDAKSEISSQESTFVANRRKNTIPAMQSLLKSINIMDFDVDGYFQNYSGNLPNISLAFSGGGYRAMLNGAGAIKAFDAREQDSKILGGLLQSSTYMAALSGGSWLLSSVFYNDFSTISALQTHSHIWNLTTYIYDPLTGTSYKDILELFSGFIGEIIAGKAIWGYPYSIVDLWGRALSQRFFGDNSGTGHGDFGVNLKLSQLWDPSGTTPFPIIVTESRSDKQNQWFLENTTVFEITPLEFGSWDPTVSAFIDTQYIGSEMSNGVVQSGNCAEGYDQAGFIAGISSDVFAAFFADLFSGPIRKYLDRIPGFSWVFNLVNGGFLTAEIGPNPWYQYQSTSNPKGLNATGVTDNILYLVDGGTDGQNIPFEPLIEPAREVSIIIAIDTSGGNEFWPDGSALQATYNRSQLDIGHGVPFPAIPDANTFLNLGLTRRPVFFGCDRTDSPLIVSIANAPYITQSNVSTWQMPYTYAERDLVIENGGLAATFGNGTGSQEFRVCLGCAILSRSFSQTGFTPPDACTKCFDAYCWNGATNDSTPDPYWNDKLIGYAPPGLGINFNGSEASASDFVVQDFYTDL